MFYNVIIIGNGFDLAHGLKTSYTDFLFYVYKTPSIRNKFIFNYENIDAYTKDKESFIEKIKLITRNYPGTKKIKFKNYLFELFQIECVEKNWCDIEELYFNTLKQEKNIEHVKTINENFLDFKNEFLNYMKLIELTCPKIEAYKKFFDNFNNNTFIFNFNYTNTYSQYITPFSTTCIDLHGQINNSVNNPVFGYSLTDENYDDFRNKFNDSTYEENIKNRDYIISNSYQRFYDTFRLFDNHSIKVYILGHSCSISDQKILYEIFSHNAFSKVTIFKYGDSNIFKKYFDNLNKIIGKTFSIFKITNYNESPRMPQINDSQELNIDFENHLNNLIK